MPLSIVNACIILYIGGYTECRDCGQGATQGSIGTAQNGSQTRAGDTINASML